MELATRICDFTHNVSVLSGILFIGYLLSEKKEPWTRTILLIAFSLVLCPFLKGIFQVPLPENFPIELGYTIWAFPSGHMFTTIIIWGWLSWEFRSRWLLSLGLLIIGLQAYVVVANNFHTVGDVLGSLFFAPCAIALHAWLNKKTWVKNNFPAFVLILFFTALALTLNIPNRIHLDGPWTALGILLGVSASLKIVQILNLNLGKRARALSVIYCVIWITLTQYTFSQLPLSPKAPTSLLLNSVLLMLGIIAISPILTSIRLSRKSVA